ncbi:unnamed protein product [Paramecium sonneborni]|uniref:Protein kinase domain-containing protein n=1 Tax=Paramecium sonneborni TaxID=65129 RepID=A0A8S1JYA3_9CILI|nr:unnamed protein product [Paramecium sonneborni]
MDIKPENMLLDENYILKLSDFGLIEFNPESSEYQGTKGYMAPEVQKGEKYSTKKADIFSLGCTFIAIRSGVYPFGDGQLDMNNPIYVSLLQDPKSFWNHFVNLVENENKLKIHFEEEFKDLIERMLNNIPDKRPTIDQVFNHPYFKLYQQQLNEQAFIQFMTQQFITKNIYQIELQLNRVAPGKQNKKVVVQLEIEQIGLNQFRFRNDNKYENFYSMVKKFFIFVITKLEDAIFQAEIPEEYQQINISYLISEMKNKCKIGVLEIPEEETIILHLIDLEGCKKDQNKLKKRIRDILKSQIQFEIIKQNEQNI